MSASRPPCWPSGTVLAVTLRGGRSQSHRRARAAVSPSRASQSPAFGRRSSHESSWHSLLVNWASEPVSLRHPGMGPEAPARKRWHGRFARIHATGTVLVPIPQAPGTYPSPHYGK